jgi:hypothetical protein
MDSHKPLEIGVTDKGKILWSGKVISVQPRIRLLRSFDQRSHSYLGYILQIHDTIGEVESTIAIGIGKGAQAKHQFRVGDFVSGKSEVVPDARTEVAEYYKTGQLRLINREVESGSGNSPPPWHGVPPELEIYRQRGHRRLDAHTYGGKCVTCIWGCRMAVEMIIDQWNPSKKRYRFETFCYGPKSCTLYKAGPIRKVPGRKGMVWEEEDWVDEDAVSHRGMDD